MHLAESSLTHFGIVWKLCTISELLLVFHFQNVLHFLYQARIKQIQVLMRTHFGIIERVVSPQKQLDLCSKKFSLRVKKLKSDVSAVSLNQIVGIYSVKNQLHGPFKILSNLIIF